MARRQDGGGGYRGLVVAALDAFADEWNAKAAQFDGPMMARSQLAEDIDAGHPVTVSATTLFRALWRFGHPDAERFAAQQRRYILDADGTLTPA